MCNGNTIIEADNTKSFNSNKNAIDNFWELLKNVISTQCYKLKIFEYLKIQEFRNCRLSNANIKECSSSPKHSNFVFPNQ